MEAKTHKLRDYFKVKHDCPKELHWLGIGFQLWALTIFLYTFSNGFFISRIFLGGRAVGTIRYYNYPQFWYVVLGCSVLPILAILLKRRVRMAWVILVASMAGLFVACLLLLVPELRTLARIGYGTLLLNGWLSLSAIVILLRNRAELFLKWDETPGWAEARVKKNWRKRIRAYLTEFRVVPRVDLSNWKKELVDAGFLLLRTMVTVAALTITVVMFGSLTDGPLRGIVRFFSMSDAIESRSVWRQRLVLRSFPFSKLMEPICLCRVDYLYEAIQMGNADTAKVFDEAYVELYKYSDSSALDEVRVRGLTYGIHLGKDDVTAYYYGLNADRLTTDASYRCMSAAVRSGSLEQVKILLIRGHNLSVVGPWRQESVLEKTIYDNKIDMARWLIAQGLSPDSRNKYGETPLFLAINYKQLDMADLLVESGADPNAFNAEGNTLFHELARSYWDNDQTKIMATVTWLREHGVSPEALNDNWDKPIDLVSKEHKDDWINLLDGKQLQPTPEVTEPGWFEELQTAESGE